MNTDKYTVGSQLESWNGSTAQSLTFIVTEDCNLRCKYCYITHKASNKKMNFSVAKKFIDYVLDSEMIKQHAVTLDFIGGEPLLEIELIDKICDYFKLKTYEMGISWYWNYRISICTNGVNYLDKRIQKFISKNKSKLSMTITIDGTKAKHDLQRVFPDGTGSYDVVKKNVDVWKNQFYASTKVTFASADLKYLKDSIIELWQEGIPEIAANVVFEDVWKEDDDKIFEEQLRELADYILENHLFDKYQCSLFDDSIGQPYTEDMLKLTSCGAGKMLAVGVDGKLYPCMRYCSYSLNHQDEYVIGHVNTGIDYDKVRPFEAATFKLQSDEECINCKIASGCSFCQGFNYDNADTPTNFQRAKYICKMHKARVRANNYYFSKLYNMYGIERKSWDNESFSMNFLLSNCYVACCMEGGKNDSNIKLKMDKQTILKGLQHAHENFYRPIFIHSKYGDDLINYKEFEAYRILHIVPAKVYEESKKMYKDVLPVFTLDDINDMAIKSREIENIIFNISEKDINKLYDCILKLWKIADRINLNIIDLNGKFELDVYKKQLQKIKDIIVMGVHNNSFNKELNVLTDILFINQHNNCGAGDKAVTLGPDGKFYVCPAFYSDKTEKDIGNLENGIDEFPNKQLYTQKFAPVCNCCDAYHCVDCVYHNKKYTTEVHIPASSQCQKSWVEKNVSAQIVKECQDIATYFNAVKESDEIDPINILRRELAHENIGYYTTK